MLPPFTSFMVVPVWFGGHVISISEVGWRRLHPLPKEDAQLLDSVAHYLSVQLASAFTSLRSQRADQLASLETELREELLEAVPGRELGAEGYIGLSFACPASWLKDAAGSLAAFCGKIFRSGLNKEGCV